MNIFLLGLGAILVGGRVCVKDKSISAMMLAVGIFFLGLSFHLALLPG